MVDLEKRVALLEKQVARLTRGPKPRVSAPVQQPDKKPAAKPKK